MNDRGRIGRWLPRGIAAGLAIAGLLVCPCWPVVLFFTCYSPVQDAAATARRHAEARGYRMAGYVGDILAEPDALGACEVRFDFTDLSADPPRRVVTIRLRRGWALGGWDVVEMREGPYPLK